MKSKLGRATALDHHINRPAYVKTDLGKALDNFFAMDEYNEVSKNPDNWGENHSTYEDIILEDYGNNRRGTDMKNRFTKMKDRA